MNNLNLKINLGINENVGAAFNRLQKQAAAMGALFDNNRKKLFKFNNLLDSAKGFDERLNKLRQEASILERLKRQPQEASKRLNNTGLNNKILKERISSARKIANRKDASIEDKNKLLHLLAVQERYNRIVEIAKTKQRDLNNQVKKSSQKFQHQRAILIQQRQALRQAGYDVKNLKQAEQALENQVKKTNNALKFRQKLSNFGASLNNQANKFATRLSGLSSFAGNIGIIGMSGMGAVRGASSKINSFIETARGFEDLETTLKTIEGSSEKASQAFAWINKMAVKTPYDIQQLSEAFVKLRAYGIEPMNGVLETLGDTASAMGKPLNQAVEAIADAVVGENERLKEFGVKASTKKGKITYSYIDKNNKQRSLQVKSTDRKGIEKALMKIFKERYGGSMEERSKTFSGIVSNLGDQWTRFQKMVMDSDVFANITRKLEKFLNKLDEMAENGELKAWAQDLASVFNAVFESLWSIGEGIASFIKKCAPFIQANKDLIAGFGKWFVIGSALATAIAPLIFVIGSLGSAFLGLFSIAKATATFANPFVLAFSAIATAAYLWIENWQQIKNFFLEIWESLSASFAHIWDKIVGFASAGIEKIAAGIDYLYKKLEGIITAVQGTISTITSAYDKAVDYTSGLMEKTGGFFSNVGDKIGNAYNSAIDGVSNSLFNAFGNEPVHEGLKGKLQKEKENKTQNINNQNNKPVITNNYNINVSANSNKDIANEIQRALKNHANENKALEARSYFV